MKKHILFDLFATMFLISSFTFGGGYIVVPIMQKRLVERLQYLKEEELFDMAAIAQSMPGAISVNLSVLIGYHVKGWRGAIICCLGSILPPLILLSFISFYYKEFRSNRIISVALKGMEAGVSAIIVSFVVDMSRLVYSEKNRLLLFIIPSSFVASMFLQINVALIIIICVFLCILQAASHLHKKSVGV